MKNRKTKEKTIDLSRCKVGQRVRLRNRQMTCIASFDTYDNLLPVKLGNGNWHKNNGRFELHDKRSPLDVVEIIKPVTKKPTPPADPSATTGWMVVNAKDELYEASNAPTRRASIMHHEGSTGFMWPDALAHGDRLVRVEIKILRKTK